MINTRRALSQLRSPFFRKSVSHMVMFGQVVVGSYVPKSSEQLGLLLNEGHVTGIELDVTQVISSGMLQIGGGVK